MSLFEIMGVTAIVAGATAGYALGEDLGVVAQALTVVAGLIAGAWIFLRLRSVWIRMAFDEPPTPAQNRRALLLYAMLPLSIVAVSSAAGWLVRALFRVAGG